VFGKIQAYWENIENDIDLANNADTELKVEVVNGPSGNDILLGST